MPSFRDWLEKISPKLGLFFLLYCAMCLSAELLAGQAEGCDSRNFQSTATPSQDPSLAQLEGVYVKQGEDFVRVSALDQSKLGDELVVVIGKPIVTPLDSSQQQASQKSSDDAFSAFVKSGESKAPVSLWKLGKETSFRLGRIFPLPRDLEKPSRDEVTSAPRKILIPGIITFSVQSYLQGGISSVAIPVTIANAANSWVMGTFHKTFGNWFRRSILTPTNTGAPGEKPGMVVTTLRNLMITTLFTTVLYWSGQGSLKEFTTEVVTLAGWQTFITQQWLSILFNVAWRTPTQSVVFSWEGEKFKLGDPETNQEVRRSSSAINRMISYGMTQFYIASILTESSLFKIVYDLNDGLHILGSKSDLGSDQVLLMSPNLGHAAMAGMGILAATLLRKVQTMDRLGVFALKFDNVEWALISTIFRPLNEIHGGLKKAWNYFRQKIRRDDIADPDSK